MRTRIIPCLAALLAITATLLTPSIAETASTLTNTITLDTRGAGDLSVTGRVLNSQTNAALAGATVTLAGLSTTSASNGTFTLAGVSLTSGTTLTASASGFLSQTRTVSAASGVKAVSVGDIALAPSTNMPVVEIVKPDVDGIFISGFGLLPNLKATVNWNGNTPGQVQFLVNGTVFGNLTGSGPNYTASLDIDNALGGTTRITGNTITVTAIAQEAGKSSAPYELRMAVVPVPAGLRAVVNSGLYQKFGPDQVGFDFELSNHKYDVTLPLVGKFGFEWGANASFDYTIKDGAWEAAVGFGAEGKKGKRGNRPSFPGLTRYPKAKLYIGNKEIIANVDGYAAGTASRATGIVFQTVGVNAGLSTRLELARYGLVDIFGPGLTTLFSKVPGVGKALKNVSVIVWLIPALDGSASVKVSPFDFNEATLTGKLGIEGAYEPEIGDIFEGRVYIGADGALTFGLPEPVFRDITLRIYGGYELKAWVFTRSKEVVWVSYSYPSASRRLPLTGVHDIGTGYAIEAVGNRTATWKPVDRPWRENGSEVFLQGTAGPERRLSADAAGALDLFTRMGNATSPGAVYAPAAGPDRRIASDPALPAQAELPLLQNVYPSSDPALTSNGNKLMLLYVRDSGAANAVQFTEIAATYFDGSTWTTPSPVAADPRGQFEPALAFDGQGAAVAVWTRVKDAAFTGTEVDTMAATMEIVSAKWDPATGVWGAATALTDNAFLDHKPRLAGPLSDGDLILTWRENQANLLQGTGSAGAMENTHIMTRRWDAATSTWGPVQVLLADLSNELSDSLVAKSGKAVYAWTRDLDGNLDDLNDSELLSRTWSETSGSWGTVTRHTNDALYDRNARLALDDAGTAYCLWQRGDNLVMDVNFSGNPTVVRTDSASLGFSDVSVMLSPGGNVVALWQEMNQYGSDAHYRVFDPASNTWGLDTMLSQDSDLERSFATAWDAMGNLVLAYDNVTVTKQTKTVALEGGETVTVDGVPQPGQVDLLLAKRAIVKDLTLSANGLTADGTDYLPGDAIVLKAKVQNSGNVAVQDAAVGFYDGDPAAGGILIQTVTVPGWLKAADEVEVTANWTIPAPAIARTVYAKADPTGAVTEASETNNTLSLPLNGVNLQLEYVSGSVLPDGSARVVARVKNLSAPESPVTMLRLKQKDATTTLAEINVSQLAPDDSVEIPLDLPAGSQPEGERSYQMTVDDEALSGDVDATNNEVLFSLNLWIDADGDGIPHVWEASNGMSDANAADALLDPDGDGFNNKQEYLAGTNPRDANSVLKIGEIARQSTPDGLSTLVSWASVAGRSYRVERSYDMAHWDVLNANVDATPPLNTVVDGAEPPGGKAFYRLVVAGQ